MKKSENLPQGKKVFVGPSKIHGLGIITKRNIKRGEIVYIIKGKVVKWKVKDLKSSLYGPNWIGYGKDSWIDPSGFSIYLNHSSNPNCGVKGRVTVRAMRDIKTGEEITVDYSIIEGDSIWYMEDINGNHKRKLIRGIQFLPTQTYKKYLPYIPKHFQKVYNNHHKLNKRNG